MTGLWRRLRAWWRDYLLADATAPDWPLRCSMPFCQDAAAPHMLPTGRVLVLCDDCLDHALAVIARRAQRQEIDQ